MSRRRSPPIYLYLWSYPSCPEIDEEPFFFTNITPQHAAYNQSGQGGLWGELENAIFEDVEVERLRVSVIGGPIFREDDPIYRKVKIPTSFWKLIAYVDADDQHVKAKAFVLTQRDLLNDIEALSLDPFRVYQVSVKELGQLAGLRFPTVLVDTDTFSAPEGAESAGPRDSSVREVRERSEIVA